MENQDLEKEITDLIVSAKDKAGGIRQLGDLAGASRPAVYTWLSGDMPKLPYLLKILEYMGGDFRRALPSWTTSQGENREIERLTAENERLLVENERLTAENEALKGALRTIQGVIAESQQHTGGGEQ